VQVKCSKCSRAIALTDAIQLVDGRLSHVECNRPSALTAEERQLAFVYCSHHAVTHCASCDREFRFSELSTDVLGGGRTNLCPRCRQDLTENVRAHVFRCMYVPFEIRSQAQAVREAALRLVRQSLLADRSDALIRKAEAHLFERQQALRVAMAEKA
jgi:hypothetical protein